MDLEYVIKAVKEGNKTKEDKKPQSLKTYLITSLSPLDIRKPFTKN